MISPLLLALFLSTLLSSALAAGGPPPVFVPGVTPAIVALVLYGLSGFVHWIQFFRIGKRFMLPLPIGMTAMAIGFVVRILVHHNPTSLGLNIGTTLLILLSPCLFLALDYVILGRLARLFGPEVAKKCMLVAPTRVAAVFVTSDVTTFLIQGVGGSMLTSTKINTINLGNKIVLVGLGIQLASFALFTTLAVSFGFRVKKHFPHVWRATGNKDFALFGKGPSADWHILYYTLCFSCVGILIRSFFRLAEFIQGHKGFISTHEVFFYLFDSLALWIVMTLYCSVWPPRFLDDTPREAEAIELQRN
ncbi:RTA1 like protein-domain-containing protein [Mycena galericulata]|nr:RTA1 like protein-domain-containing protein [Mycena galericulata]